MGFGGCVCVQARHFRLYSQEVVELGHGVSFLLLLPAADNVCSAPGQSNPYTPLSGFLHLPLQMFELGNNAHTLKSTLFKDLIINKFCWEVSDHWWRWRAVRG